METSDVTEVILKIHKKCNKFCKDYGLIEHFLKGIYDFQNNLFAIAVSKPIFENPDNFIKPFEGLYSGFQNLLHYDMFHVMKKDASKVNPEQRWDWYKEDIALRLKCFSKYKKSHSDEPIEHLISVYETLNKMITLFKTYKGNHELFLNSFDSIYTLFEDYLNFISKFFDEVGDFTQFDELKKTPDPYIRMLKYFENLTSELYKISRPK